MSRKTVAAILTQIYIMHGGTDSVSLPGTPENEEYSSKRAYVIGSIYAGFLADLPRFEAWGKQNNLPNWDDPQTKEELQ